MHGKRNTLSLDPEKYSFEQLGEFLHLDAAESKHGVQSKWEKNDKSGGLIELCIIDTDSAIIPTCTRNEEN